MKTQTQKQNIAGWYSNEIRGDYAQNTLISTDPNRPIDSLPPFTYWWEEGELTKDGAATSTDGINFFTEII